MERLKRAWWRMVAWFFVPGLLLAAGCAMAPPEEATAQVQALVAAQEDSIARLERNATATNATWAATLLAAKSEALTDAFEARLKTLVEADSRPSSDAVLQEIRWRDEVAAANRAEIEKALVAVRDPNLDETREINAVLRAFLLKMTEREREAAAWRQLLGLKLPAAKDAP